MISVDQRITAYIEKAAPFAQPILVHLRNIIHDAVPGIEEKIKWSFPCFDFKGPVCHMAAFQSHATFGFWKAKLMEDPAGLFGERSAEAMGQLGRITRLDDLPHDEVLMQYIRAAADLNERGIKAAPARKKAERSELVLPDYFTAALAGNVDVARVFHGFSYSHKKEYLEWIGEAKTDATRERRLASALEMIAEGKSRHWK